METWVFNDTLSGPGFYDGSDVNFASDNEHYRGFFFEDKDPMILYYEKNIGMTLVYNNAWLDEKYKTIIFEEPVDLTSSFGQ